VRLSGLLSLLLSEVQRASDGARRAAHAGAAAGTAVIHMDIETVELDLPVGVVITPQPPPAAPIMDVTLIDPAHTSQRQTCGIGRIRVVVRPIAS
jgi:hypothetical protein